MPSATASDSAPPPRHDDLDNYGVGDLSDDPFASPSPPSSAKKRKEPDDGLGINKEVSVQKRARVPNVKLDEDRLLSEAGIPRLRKRARNLKLKGKGHEFSDASRLLSFYQLWLDDLFPKAKFLDALAMVEKAGHKKRVMTARGEWISEGKPKDRSAADADEEDDADYRGDDAPPAARPATPPPPQGDVPDDDDLYDATPRRSRPAPPTAPPRDAPDDDDLDALMAEAETHDRPAPPAAPSAPNPKAQDEEPGDDLDALMAEAEAHDQGAAQSTEAPPTATSVGGNDFADEEAAMQELDGLW